MKVINTQVLEQKAGKRRSLRLKDYDYSQEGAYFITVCIHNRKCILGEIIDNEMCLNKFGKIIESEWLQTEILRSYVALDAYVVMPNHFHGIVFLHQQARATQRVAPTKKNRLKVLNQVLLEPLSDNLNRRSPSE